MALTLREKSLDRGECIDHFLIRGVDLINEKEELGGRVRGGSVDQGELFNLHGVAVIQDGEVLLCEAFDRLVGFSRDNDIEDQAASGCDGHHMGLDLALLGGVR